MLIFNFVSSKVLTKNAQQLALASLVSYPECFEEALVKVAVHYGPVRPFSIRICFL